MSQIGDPQFDVMEAGHADSLSGLRVRGRRLGVVAGSRRFARVSDVLIDHPAHTLSDDATVLDSAACLSLIGPHAAFTIGPFVAARTRADPTVRAPLREIVEAGEEFGQSGFDGELPVIATTTNAIGRNTRAQSVIEVCMCALPRDPQIHGFKAHP